MPISNIVVQRLRSQQLTQTRFKTPGQLVTWLGAVQAQDYAGAKWALGLRLPGTTDDELERAFSAGDILRTHVMRPTWHFVTPADIRWLLALTGPRVNAANASRYRDLQLDTATLSRSETTLAKALQGGQQRTRLELVSALKQAGIATDGLRLVHILMRAELDGIICSGARRGKQFTYALLDERAPAVKTLDRDEALAELTRRYFTSHGPATVQDFVWWSGLTAVDVRAGLEMVGAQLKCEEVDGRTYWFSAARQPGKEFPPAAYLLPNYDEYIVGYTDRSAVLEMPPAEKLDARGNPLFNNLLVVEGRVVGTWQRAFEKGAAVITLNPFTPLTAAQRRTVAAAAQRYGEFLGMAVSILPAPS